MLRDLSVSCHRHLHLHTFITARVELHLNSKRSLRREMKSIQLQCSGKLVAAGKKEEAETNKLTLKVWSPKAETKGRTQIRNLN